jgi:hypothetical protein
MARLHSLRMVVTYALAMTFAFTSVSFGQGTQAQTVKWDDYVFKFLPGGQMAQVMTSDGKVVGTILQMNGELQIIPLPGNDADKLKKSFEDWKRYTARTHSGDKPAADATTAPSPGQQPGSPAAGSPSPSAPGNGSETSLAAIRFDDASHTITVPRPDGVTVTFVGEDVKIAAFHRLNYLLRHQKGSAGRLVERSVLHPNRVGGSVAGGGVEFLLDGGGIIYDSGMGGVNLQENRQVLVAKQLSQVAVDAVADVRKVAGHENFMPPGYNTLKEISQYRLRSDGSR